MNSLSFARPFLVLACAAVFLASCSDDDIDQLAANLPPPPLACGDVAPYTVTSGTPPVNGDGSLTFSTAGSVTFNASFPSGGVVRMCTRGILASGSVIAAGILVDGTGNSAFIVTSTQSGANTLTVNVTEDNSGAGCPARNFSGPPFAPGAPFFFAYKVDQTDAFPVLKIWLKKPAPGEAPILNSADPAYCLADSSVNWVTSNLRRATFNGTNVTLAGARFDALQ